MIPRALVACWLAGCSAGATPAVTPVHSCASHLGTKPWEGGIGGFNPCTGNLKLVFDAGPINLIWNSLDADRIGPAGLGMRLSVRDRLAVETDGSVLRTLSDGETIRYVAAGAAFQAPVETETNLSHPEPNRYLIRSSDGGALTYTRKNGSAWVLTRLQDPDGHAATIEYDAFDREVRIVDASSKAIRLEWTGELLSRIYDEQGQAWTLLRNSSGELSEIRGPTSVETLAYAPGGKHLIVVDRDPARGEERYQYNPDGSLAGSIDGQGKKSTIASAAGEVRIRNDWGQTTTLRFSPGGDLAEVIDPAGAPMLRLAYDTGHQLQSTTDSRGRSVSFGPAAKERRNP